MSSLSHLRGRLNQLGRRRALLRWGTAFAAGVVTVCLLLGADFLLDVSLQMDRWQRLVALLFIAGGCAWSYNRFARPFLRRRESELEMALLVERQQEIDTDLVAALQFESAEAPQWGSRELEQAVIEYVADFGKTLNVYQGLDIREFKRRAITAGSVLCVALLVAVIWPAHCAVFFNRLLLGSQHYPTRTRIEKFFVNDKAVPFDAGPGYEFVVPFGKSLRFEIAASGELPERGRAVLVSTRQGVQTQLELLPAQDDSQALRVFHGELPRLVDSVDFQVYLGDAWSDSARARLIPLPVVTLELEAIPPEYAQVVEAAAIERTGSRQLAVLEGSRVNLQARCANKPLKSVTLKIEDQTFQLTPLDDQRQTWGVPEGETPLSVVTTPIRYSLQVEDEDGLGLEQPLTGYIRLKGDRPPRIIAAVISKKVLPAARPHISFGVTDDYGVAEVRIVQQVIHEDGTEEPAVTSEVVKLPASPPPPATHRGRFQANFKPLQLDKGDQVRIVLEAVDYRGKLPGKTATSEPVLLEITDVQGFLASMAETDEQSARRLDAIIQRQLGIGETK